MIGLAEAGKVKTVIVKDMSRMGRDYLKVGYYTESFFAERDIRYIAINDGVEDVYKRQGISFSGVWQHWQEPSEPICCGTTNLCLPFRRWRQI